ncbi:MAG: MFS transporter [Anaerolineae bacterium]|nr:MAG: MFS transporter [Anaerolineae bacterium]
MSTNKPRFGAITDSFARIGRWFQRAWGTIKPGPRAWRGAALGMLALAGFALLLTSHAVFLARPRIVSFLTGSIQFIALAALAGGLLVLLVTLLHKIPAFYGWALVAALVLLYVSFGIGVMVNVSGLILLLLAMVVVASLTGAGVWVLVRGWRDLTNVQLVVTLVGLGLGLLGLLFGAFWLLHAGPSVQPPPNAAALSPAQITPLDMPDPSQPGPYGVRTLTYGSGEDRHRPEYGADVGLVTGSVDGSPMIGEEWNAGRTNFWGFGPDAVPINGRAWYPEGEGPFPLALIVHGDHIMYEFSDPGYDYLGELLASRGFILASVDANFMNAAAMGGLDNKENDARGWLLLEHLRFWEQWNATPGNPFHQKVDMEAIAVMGHSRGGEAAPVAAAFNRLSHYPDDATMAFDYNYNIRSVVAIAPVFETYMPRGQHLPLENVSYLVLQGSNDQQILSFMGLSQYARVSFTDGDDWFKAALYIYGANHGQFNTTWVTDQTGPARGIFNQRAVMAYEEQKRVARVYITAFLEATLRGESGYIPLFRDHRVARVWLPDTVYLNLFQGSADRLVSTYEEDIDVKTTTMPGGEQSGENLTLWREGAVELLASVQFGPIDTSAVYLGWDAESSGDLASYAISLPEEGLTLDVDSTLIFSLADAGPTPTSSEGGSREPIDLTVEVIDGAGRSARLPLSSYSYLQPQIVSVFAKAPFLNITGPSPSEAIFQSFEYPLAAFAEANPTLDPADLAAVRLLFDRTPAGVVVLDDVGFRK